MKLERSQGRRMKGLAHSKNSKQTCEVMRNSTLRELMSVKELYMITNTFPRNIISYPKKINGGCWSGGVMVKFVLSAWVAWGSQVWIVGADLALLVRPRCGGVPHKNRARLAQMLAQGQYSPQRKKINRDFECYI